MHWLRAYKVWPTDAELARAICSYWKHVGRTFGTARELNSALAHELQSYAAEDSHTRDALRQSAYRSLIRENQASYWSQFKQNREPSKDRDLKRGPVRMSTRKRRPKF